MAQKGSTPNALLGLLSIHPRSGYDIRQLIPRSIGHFWNESYGQIYPALKHLTADGLVNKKTERHKGRPDRNVYSLTASGRKELRHWLQLPVEPAVQRNELLLKLFFGAHSTKGVSRKHVATYEDQQRATLKIYTATARKLTQEQPDDPHLPFWLMTLNFGRHRCVAAIKWCTETLRELERLENAAALKT